MIFIFTIKVAEEKEVKTDQVPQLVSDKTNVQT
jgi:hypothetical protein